MRALLLLVVASAGASGDHLLAPTVEDLDRSLARVERLLERAEEEGDRLADAQRAWVDEGCVLWTCPPGRAAALAVASRAAGHDGRDLLQSARAELDRAERMATFGAVRPLVEGPRARRKAALGPRLDAAVRTWLVRAGWQRRWIEPWAVGHGWLVGRTCLPPDDGVEP
jgi:hypothetical protein